MPPVIPITECSIWDSSEGSLLQLTIDPAGPYLSHRDLQANVVVRLPCHRKCRWSLLRYDYPISRILEMHGPSICNEDFVAVV